MEEENKNAGLTPLTYEADGQTIEVLIDSEKGAAWMSPKESKNELEFIWSPFD